MGAPLHIWARVALLLLLVCSGGLVAPLFLATHSALGRPIHGRHARTARAIGRARVPTHRPIGVRVSTFAMTPGVVHLSTCLGLRGRVAPPWPWADGKTYVEIKAAMKLAHTTACARCKPVTRPR